MSIDDAIPAKRIYVTFGGREWELVPTDKLTMPELKETKRITDMPPADMEVAFGKGDPDAWLAMLYVSIRRVEPGTTLSDVMRMFGETPLGDVIETIRDDTPEVAVPDPPARTLPSGGETTPNGSGSGEKTLPLSTPAISGRPTLETRT